MRTRMRRLLTLAFALLLVVAACGGDTGDGGTTAQEDQAQTTTQPDATEPDATQPDVDDSGDSEGSGPSTATVTVGDQTYHFSSEGAVVAQCLTDLFGIYSIQLPMVDDSGAQADGFVTMAILHADTDPEIVEQVNAVQFDVGDDTWVADPSHEWFLLDGAVVEPGMSQVDSVEFDGKTVRGTATFLQETYGELGEPVTGTFEATCGEERVA